MPSHSLDAGSIGCLLMGKGEMLWEGQQLLFCNNPLLSEKFHCCHVIYEKRTYFSKLLSEVSPIHGARKTCKSLVLIHKLRLVPVVWPHVKTVFISLFISFCHFFSYFDLNIEIFHLLPEGGSISTVSHMRCLATSSRLLFSFFFLMKGLIELFSRS